MTSVHSAQHVGRVVVYTVILGTHDVGYSNAFLGNVAGDPSESIEGILDLGRVSNYLHPTWP